MIVGVLMLILLALPVVLMLVILERRDDEASMEQARAEYRRELEKMREERMR